MCFLLKFQKYKTNLSAMKYVVMKQSMKILFRFSNIFFFSEKHSSLKKNKIFFIVYYSNLKYTKNTLYNLDILGENIKERCEISSDELLMLILCTY